MGGAVVLLLVVLPLVTPAATTLPLYCGSTAARPTAPIPPLPSTAAAALSLQPGSLSLVSLAVLIRHGSRTVTHPLVCWNSTALDEQPFNCTINTADTHLPLSATLPTPRLFARHNFAPAASILALNPVAARDNIIPGGSCIMGQLLPVGYEQQRRNGQLLAAAYVGPSASFADFLDPNTTDTSLFYLRSDNSPRTIASGQALFAAMLPPPHPAAIVPWNIAAAAVDPLNPSNQLCSVGSFKADADKTIFGRQASSAYSALEMELAAKIQAPNPSRLFDCYNVYTCNGLQVSPGVDASFGERLTTAATEFTAALATNPAFAARYVGPLLAEVRSKLLSFQNAPNATTKFSLYSGHDVTLFPILGVLLEGANATTLPWPPYAAMVTIEIHSGRPLAASSNQAFWVRLVYNGAVRAIRSCPNSADEGMLCPLSTFLQLIESIIPTAEECSEPFTNTTASPTALPCPASPVITITKTSEDCRAYRIVLVLLAIAVAFALILAVYVHHKATATKRHTHYFHQRLLVHSASVEEGMF